MADEPARNEQRADGKFLFFISHFPIRVNISPFSFIRRNHDDEREDDDGDFPRRGTNPQQQRRQRHARPVNQ